MEKAKRYWPLIVLALFFALGGAYASGFRLGPGLTLERLSTLSITALPEHAQVFIDGNDRTQSRSPFSARLLPGRHSVIASATGFWPWQNIVTVTSSKTNVEALLIPTSPAITIETGA